MTQGFRAREKEFSRTNAFTKVGYSCHCFDSISITFFSKHFRNRLCTMQAGINSLKNVVTVCQICSNSVQKTPTSNSAFSSVQTKLVLSSNLSKSSTTFLLQAIAGCNDACPLSRLRITGAFITSLQAFMAKSINTSRQILSIS